LNKPANYQLSEKLGAALIVTGVSGSGTLASTLTFFASGSSKNDLLLPCKRSETASLFFVLTR